MDGLIPLLKKEIKEQWKTYRFLVVISVFLLLGLTTPLTLKYLPELMKLSGVPMELSFPPPTAVQSLMGFAGDIGQVGVFVIVLIAMGSIANEVSRGTALIILSKPVSRTAFVTAKLLALSLTTIVALSVASAVCFAYTVWLIQDTSATAFLGLTLLLALFMVFSIATTLLFSSLFRSSLAAGGVALGVIIGQAILSILPYAGDYMPGKLLGWGNELLTGGDAYWGALAVTLALTGLFIYLAQHALKTRDI